MASLMDVFVPVRPDTDGFEPDLRRQLARVDASKSGKQVAARFGVGFNGAVGSIAAKGAGIFAAGFAAVKGLQMFGGFITEAAESAKISRITQNAIRATGGSAKITAAQVSDLATAISNKTAIDDEQIQASANMLLTFKNIRNETGKGNDIFNQAAMAAANLSVQFGGIDGASKQLGKALNDPIKGTTALAKAGVTFTDQQKDQIKTLVESGKTLDAQKIILAEIQSQVGGAATAAADPMSRLKVIAGNLGESIGGFLLPTVNRFANFISDKLIPGMSGLADLIFKGDFTSKLSQAFNIQEDSGFVTFLLNARTTAINVFSEIKGGISAFAAAWKFNDGEITSSGFPGFMERLGFGARQTFDFFKTEVLPRLREFAVYLRDTVIPIVVAIVKDHFAKLKGIFNDVRDAVAENKPQLTQLWNGFQAVAKVVIEKVIPFLYQVGSATLPALGKAISSVITVTGGIIRAFNAIKEPIRAAIAFVWEKVSGVFSSILTGAAKAFGWVPNVGDKLETAAKDFAEFRDDVNRSLDGIDDEAIKVAMSYSAKGVNLSAPSSVGRRATGGGIFGPGTGTSDSVPILASAGEHMWTARETLAVGGHRAMERLRAAALRGDLKGFKAGGGITLQTSIPAEGPIEAVASGVAKQFGRVLGKAMQSVAVAGPSGPPGAVQNFRGERLNTRTIRMLLNAEAMLGSAFRIMQGSYSTRVAASGGTHSGGGAMDTDGPGGWYRSQGALRRAGFASWVRLPSQGPWAQHIHSIAIGDPSASPSAKRQVQSFLRGGDGLGMWRGGPISFDKGGMLMPGLTLAHNGTGRPEPVGAGVTVTFKDCTFAGTSQKQFEDLVVGAVDKARGKRRI